jgi:hypothetical protein
MADVDRLRQSGRATREQDQTGGVLPDFGFRRRVDRGRGDDLSGKDRATQCVRELVSMLRSGDAGLGLDHLSKRRHLDRRSRASVPPFVQGCLYPMRRRS